MRKKIKSGSALFFAVLLCFSVFFTVAYAAEVSSEAIPVTVELSGTLPTTPEDFVIVFKPDSGEYPMPEGSADGAYKATITGAGSADLPKITFTKAGVYTYTVAQEAGSNAKCTYDSTVYHVQVVVTNAADGSLETAIVIYIKDVSEKLDAIVFKNKYETVVPPPPPPPPVIDKEISVLKVWADNGYGRPESVTVQLMDGETVVETVVLGNWNNWSYVWKNLDASDGHNWHVREVNVPRGYRESYYYEGSRVIIRNTETLIQTGQLNWPIPVLTVLGLGLIALGVVVLVKRKSKNA